LHRIVSFLKLKLRKKKKSYEKNQKKEKKEANTANKLDPSIQIADLKKCLIRRCLVP
jgi:hypothetical protein